MGRFASLGEQNVRLYVLAAKAAIPDTIRQNSALATN